MNDLRGQFLMPYRATDTLRHKTVWAVYKIARESLVAERQSDVSNVTTAKAKADALNADRPDGYYFRVFRLSTPSERKTKFGQSTRWR